ncbi:MAG: hypothetical protein QXU20_01610 [Candidatus Woesearchaeota archaeon]
MLEELEDLINKIEEKNKEVKEFEDKKNYEMSFSKNYELFDLYLKFSKLCFSKRDSLNEKYRNKWIEAKNFINNFVKKYIDYEEKWVLIVDGEIKEQDENLANIIDKKILYERSKINSLFEVYVPKITIKKKEINEGE